MLNLLLLLNLWRERERRVVVEREVVSQCDGSFEKRGACRLYPIRHPLKDSSSLYTRLRECQNSVTLAQNTISRLHEMLYVVTLCFFLTSQNWLSFLKTFDSMKLR